MDDNLRRPCLAPPRDTPASSCHVRNAPQLHPAEEHLFYEWLCTYCWLCVNKVDFQVNVVLRVHIPPNLLFHDRCRTTMYARGKLYAHLHKHLQLYYPKHGLYSNGSTANRKCAFVTNCMVHGFLAPADLSWPNKEKLPASAVLVVWFVESYISTFPPD